MTCLLRHCLLWAAPIASTAASHAAEPYRDPARPVDERVRDLLGRMSLEEKIDTDVIVCGGDKAARETVIDLIHRMGLDAFDGGVLANAVAVEALTAVLIAVNPKYKVKGDGIRLVGLPRG